MKIEKLTLESNAESFTLSGECGGFTVFYTLPAELDVTLSADPFIAAALVPAMKHASDIEIEPGVPVSATLLANIDRLQEILSHWERQLGHRLHRVKIRGGSVVDDAARSGRGSASFFSGGVDGTYTFLKHCDDIDFALFVRGIDMQPDNESLFDEAFARNEAFVQERGKRLLPCSTNVRFLGHEFGAGWSLCFGGGLASIALAAGLERCFLASGVTYAEMELEGSNYITDPMWSNGVTSIVHDGAEASRNEKIQRIAREPGALDILRVCWQDAGYNCGTCEKCLRTMTSLRLLGLSASHLPQLTDAMVKQRLHGQRIYSHQSFTFVEENLRAAVTAGDRVVARVLQRQRRAYLVRKHLRGLQDAFRRWPRD